MDAKTFERVLEDTFDLVDRTLLTKAEEYAPKDRLYNFKLAGELRHEQPKEALAGMMVKHTVSIYDMIRDGIEHPLTQWDEKIIDHINYLILLRACVLEEYQQKANESDADKENHVHRPE